MAFIHENFLLHTKTAQRLFHDYAASEPILDYHNHLPPADIAGNRRFHNLFEIWLEGDHYKWRAMRANGVAEKYCTGDTDPFEKFQAWARTVPQTLRNPLYHWTHLELKRYFDIEDLLDGGNARTVWDKANEVLAQPEFSARGILQKFGVKALCTTDDPADSLEHHESHAKSGFATQMYPTFRPDKAFGVHQPELFNPWLDKLGKQANIEISKLSDLLEALEKRHADFHAIGCRLSDHGLNHAFADFPTEAQASDIFDRARKGQAADTKQYGQFASFLMLYFGRLDASRGWTKQLHLGALRSTNTRALANLGPDTGFDSIGDWAQASALAAYLDKLEQESALPKIVLYNLNPADNMVLATMIGNFQDGSVPGKIQFGSGWWFLDTKLGIEQQVDALSNTGLLSRFVGMLTDSRSFMSFPRHEYFRRVLCNMLGSEMESGELPPDLELVGTMVRNICYKNAHEQLGI